MAKTISLAMQKGGSGKTTTAVNLATGLFQKNKKVLLVDMDAQSNSTAYLGGIYKSKLSIINCLKENLEIEKLITKTDYCDLIPSNIYMSDFDIEIKNKVPISPEKYLKTLLNPIKDNYDFIIIDCPPKLDHCTFNSLVASDSVLLVIEPSDFSIIGIEQFLETYKIISSNYSLKIEGILFSRVDRKTTEFKEKYQELSEIFPKLVYDFFVPQATVVPKSQNRSKFSDNKAKPCITEFPNSLPSKTYHKLVNEILKGVKQ